MLKLLFNSLQNEVTPPFDFSGWRNQNEGRHLVKLTQVEPATVTIEQLIFVKTVDVITVYRRYDEQYPIWQGMIDDNCVILHNVGLYRTNDSDIRYILNLWANLEWVE